MVSGQHLPQRPDDGLTGLDFLPACGSRWHLKSWATGLTCNSKFAGAVGAAKRNANFSANGRDDDDLAPRPLQMRQCVFRAVN